ncbi:PLP-dependent aminotransferase family protein [Streptomyces sp. NPDC051658]|uniref:PLP-dependent aminotransferase family protein n=1 Tax=Streptomyces sp. NPDC051658 TaxID=3365667 RepID=UPI0037B718D5
MPSLSLDQLHDSLSDPLLGSISFLNEVMGRYPDAISFAPGAPHPSIFTEINIDSYTQRFIAHLVQGRGLTEAQARRTMFEYGPSRGLINDLVTDALRRDYGMDIDSDSVVITVGAQEGMLLSLRALCAKPQDVLAVVNPCFAGIAGAARVLGLPIIGIGESSAGVDLDALRQECQAARHRGQRIRACYVAPDFSNPGGSRMPLENRRSLLELAEREDFYVLEDNAYGFTAPTAAEIPQLKALDVGQRVVHIGTFAKVCFPGARVGYVVADQPVQAAGGNQLLAHHLAALKSMVTVNTSPLGQAVIGGMLLEHGGSLLELSSKKAALYRSNLAHLAHSLDQNLGDVHPNIRWNRPEGGFFIRMEIPMCADTNLLETSAAKYGVLWTPMSQFYLGSAGDCELRLSCSYLTLEEIDEGVQRLTSFLKNETLQPRR